MVYSPSDSKWYVRGCNPGDYAVFSDPSCVPVPADYDRDGRTDLAVYYPADGSWYIWQSSTDAMVRKQYGWSATCPLPADYDGDGRDDVALYDEANWNWFINCSRDNRNVTFSHGWKGAVPVLPQTTVYRWFGM